MREGKQNQQPADSIVARYQMLLEVSESITAHRDLTTLFHDLAQRLHHGVEFDLLKWAPV
jgi:Zn-dependent oligopeptidase